MKASNSFKETIKAYLDKRAVEDELFAVTYKKENKNLDECCNYIMKCAQDGKCEGYDDSEVFKWAVHYYDEDDLKNIKPISGKVIVNHIVDLTEEDRKFIKEKAIEKAIEEESKNLKVNVELSPEDRADAIEKAKAIAVEEATKRMLQKKVVKSIPKDKVEQLPDSIAESIINNTGQASLF